jgi:hypothetical protein
MAYENIRFRKPNMAVVDGYFWMLDDDLDVLVAKTDDGTQAFTYPLDTDITGVVKAIEYDGYNLWTLEQPATTSIRIRRWKLVNYICKLVDTFDLVETGSDKFTSDCMAVERYTVIFSGNEAANQNIFSISDETIDGSICSRIPNGGRIVLGPNALNQTEEFTVLQGGLPSTVRINGLTSFAYAAGDPIRFYTNFWVFNNYNGLDPTVGALYQIDPFTGTVINKFPGNEFKNINSSTFYGIPNFVFRAGSSVEPRDYSICFIKSTNMIFLNPDNITVARGSMVMDNIESNLAIVIPVYDIGMYEKNIYRLQLKATYYGTTGVFANSTYNYQLSTFNKLITSIAVGADPAILPADGYSTSLITAVVRDQFNQPVPSRLVVFTDDDAQGVMVSTNVATDSNGRATTAYRAGIEARETRITATAQQTTYVPD